ncbi:hypothetical protein VP01_3884g1 [Puccinia sorghi]|uniref:Uncharacterized protein n=1 Tax=Puccinia sorghi TaxID=27349 RepID=A0A0L6USU2_9BASI|nr:hypothetical protein VP01_3884g1 [Puccinia sorghi]
MCSVNSEAANSTTQQLTSNIFELIDYFYVISGNQSNLQHNNKMSGKISASVILISLLINMPISHSPKVHMLCKKTCQLLGLLWEKISNKNSLFFSKGFCYFSQAAYNQNRKALNKFEIPSWCDQSWECYIEYSQPIFSNFIFMSNNYGYYHPHILGYTGLPACKLVESLPPCLIFGIIGMNLRRLKGDGFPKNQNNVRNGAKIPPTLMQESKTKMQNEEGLIFQPSRKATSGCGIHLDLKDILDLLKELHPSHLLMMIELRFSNIIFTILLPGAKKEAFWNIQYSTYWQSVTLRGRSMTDSCSNHNKMATMMQQKLYTAYQVLFPSSTQAHVIFSLIHEQEGSVDKEGSDFDGDTDDFNEGEEDMDEGYLVWRLPKIFYILS